MSCMYVCMYAIMRLCMYVYMDECMHVCMQAGILVCVRAIACMHMLAVVVSVYAHKQRCDYFTCVLCFVCSFSSPFFCSSSCSSGSVVLLWVLLPPSFFVFWFANLLSSTRSGADLSKPDYRPSCRDTRPDGCSRRMPKLRRITASTLV